MLSCTLEDFLKTNLQQICPTNGHDLNLFCRRWFFRSFFFFLLPLAFFPFPFLPPWPPSFAIFLFFIFFRIRRRIFLRIIRLVVLNTLLFWIVFHWLGGSGPKRFSNFRCNIFMMRRRMRRRCRCRRRQRRNCCHSVRSRRRISLCDSRMRSRMFCVGGVRPSVAGGGERRPENRNKSACNSSGSVWLIFTWSPASSARPARG